MKECKDSNNLMGEMFTDRLIKLRQARGWTKKEFSAKNREKHNKPLESGKTEVMPLHLKIL